MNGLVNDTLSLKNSERNILIVQILLGIISAGAKAWVVKPFQPQQMLAAVSKLVLP